MNSFNKSLFIELVQNLLHIHVEPFSYGEEVPKHVIEQLCFHEDLQPMFTGEALNKMIQNMQPEILYEIRDELNIRIQLLYLEETIYVFGPYIRNELTDNNIQEVLMAHKMSAAYASSIRLYSSRFPVESAYNIRRTINSLIKTLTNRMEDFPFSTIYNYSEFMEKPAFHFQEEFDYQKVALRYETENHFLRSIELGDVENVMEAYHEMLKVGYQSQYANMIYYDPNIGLAMLRALVRKAAERGGASVVEIDEITQHAVQKMVAANGQPGQVEAMQEMILKLTEAVQQYRTKQSHYSIPIQKIMEYLRMNYSQKITLEQIAHRVGYSAPYISKVFKEEAGQTITDYIQQLRCMQAAEMLRKSNTPISDISFYVGYEDNNYFVKCFKKQYGMTPSEYRKKKEID